MGPKIELLCSIDVFFSFVSQNFLDSGERYYELKSLVSASELSKNRHHRKSSETSMLLKKSKKSASFTSASLDVDDEPVEIMGEFYFLFILAFTESFL